MASAISGNVNIAEAKRIGQVYLSVPQRAVPIFRGTPGVGKSDIVEQIAIESYAKYALKGCTGCASKSPKSLEHQRGCGAFHDPKLCNICAKERIIVTMKADDRGVFTGVETRSEPYPPHVMVIDIRLSTFDPVETKGLPFVAEGDLKGDDVPLTRWACPEWLPTDDDVYCILFLDEFLNAPAMVQNASLQLVYDRKIHTHKLGRRVMIACAGNTESDGSYITRLGGAAKNRLAHINIEVDSAAYLEWARNNGVLPEFIGAAEWKPDTFLPTEFSRDVDAQSTPRTFTMLSHLVEQNGITNDRELRRIAAPLIGSGATTELIAYIGQYQKVKPEQIIREGKMPNYDGQQASHRYAAACAVANWIHRNPEKVTDAKHVTNLFTFIEMIGAELSVKTFNDMRMADHPSLVAFILKHASGKFREIMNNLSGVITESDDPAPKRRK